MRSYNHLFEIAISDDMILSSLSGASKGKRDRQEVKRIFDNLEKYIKKFKDWLLKGGYIPIRHKAVNINDGFLLKKRVVMQPYFYPEQWTQHIVVKTLQPMFLKGMYDYTCGSIPGRGIHYGKSILRNLSEITRLRSSMF